ncbi:alpha/beta fold hydrolase [Roseibium album]|uniref:alpha/beta fold hydrolase n=1 Tax=Roseibium album TaxID=311410 RepID=UPI00391B768F
MNDPIVFVPGLLCTEALYAPQIAAFADRPILVANTREDDSIAAIAARLLEEAPNRFSLIGLSMGGYVAMEILRTAPGRVSRVALLNTSAHADSEDQKKRRSVSIKLARQRSFAKVPDLFYAGFVHEKNDDNEHLKSIVTEMAHETGPEAFVHQQTAIANRIDSRPSLSAIPCPALVLSGDGDRLIPPALSVEIHHLIPGSELAIVNDCGHLSTLEEPGTVTAKLRNFLNRP